MAKIDLTIEITIQKVWPRLLAILATRQDHNIQKALSCGHLRIMLTVAMSGHKRPKVVATVATRGHIPSLVVQ